MQTEMWKITNNERNNKEIITRAASLLKSGKLVAFPTETVYGLGADAFNQQAVSNIFRAKGRPEDNPLIAHVATKEQLRELITSLPTYAEQLIDTFSPGALTYVLPSNDKCAINVTAGLDTIAIRIPSNPVAQQLLRATNRPVAAPSANTSGKPSPTTAQHVNNDLANKVAGIVDGGPSGVGMESTVIDCTGRVPIILRPGGITKEEIQTICPDVEVSTGSSSEGEKPIAPGMKYRHYSPEIPLILTLGDEEDIQCAVTKQQQEGRRVGLLVSDSTAKRVTADVIHNLGKDKETIAMHLYDGLRYFNKSQVDVIIAESYEEKGIGVAIMNRLTKAASSIH